MGPVVNIGVALIGALITGQLALASTPQYELTLKDAGNLKQALQKNKWSQEFLKSNLYRGLMLRQSPLVNSLGSEYKESWKGRLLDYLYEKVLTGRPMAIAYYNRRGHVSPMVYQVQDLSGKEKSVLKSLISATRAFSDSEVDYQDGDASKKLMVTPLSISQQKIAVLLTGDCFNFGRDPQHVAAMSERCPKKVISEDALLRVNLKEMVPGVHGVAQKVLGFDDYLDVQMKWNPKAHRFNPTSVSTQFKNGHLIRSENVPWQILKFLPAETHLLLSGSFEGPVELSRSSIGQFMKNPSQAKKTLVTVHLGTIAVEKTSASFALVPAAAMTAAKLEEVRNLFGATRYTEVKFAKVCKGFMAFSDHSEVISKIEKSCAGKIPSLANKSSLKKLFNGSISMAAYFDMGGFAGQLMETGWASLNPSQKKTKLFQQSKALLEGLPQYGFRGIVKNNNVQMKTVF